MNLRSTGNKLGTLCRSKERPIREDGARSKNNRRRTKRLEFGTSSARNGKNFSTDLQLLMTETTKDASLLKTLVCLERQQHELIPEEYLPVRKKLSSRFGLVFMEDKIVVPMRLLHTMQNVR